MCFMEETRFYIGHQVDLTQQENHTKINKMPSKIKYQNQYCSILFFISLLIHLFFCDSQQVTHSYARRWRYVTLCKSVNHSLSRFIQNTCSFKKKRVAVPSRGHICRPHMSSRWSHLKKKKTLDCKVRKKVQHFTSHEE